MLEELEKANELAEKQIWAEQNYNNSKYQEVPGEKLSRIPDLEDVYGIDVEIPKHIDEDSVEDLANILLGGILFAFVAGVFAVSFLLFFNV